MRLPSLLRRTPFRLTLLFLALFAAAASAILAYVYFASASEARTKAERDVRGEMEILTGLHEARGLDALNREVIDRTLRNSAFLYRLEPADGSWSAGNLTVLPLETIEGDQEWTSFPFTDTDAEGRVTRPQVRVSA